MSEKELIGKTICDADVDGYGMVLTFDDGSVFNYCASEGGYSSYGWDGEDDDLD